MKHMLDAGSQTEDRHISDMCGHIAVKMPQQPYHPIALIYTNGMGYMDG